MQSSALGPFSAAGSALDPPRADAKEGRAHRLAESVPRAARVVAGGDAGVVAAPPRPSPGAGPERSPAPTSSRSPPLPHAPVPPAPAVGKGEGGGWQSAVLWKGAEGGRKEKGTETWPSAVEVAVPRAAPRRPAALTADLRLVEAPARARAPGRYPSLHAAPLETQRARRRRRRAGRGGGGRGCKSPARACRGRPGREAGAFMLREGTVLGWR